MQKLINALAILSFGVSAGIVGGGTYLYVNRDKLIDEVRVQALAEVKEIIPDIVESLLPKPELPNIGGESPIPSTLPFFD